MSNPQDLSAFLASLRGNRADVSLDRLEALLKRRQIWGARRCAVATAHLLITAVAEYKPKDSADLLSRVSSTGRRLAAAQPAELTVGNVSRRVLGLIREASDEKAMADGTTNGQPPKDISIYSVKEDVLDGIRELLDELDQADKQIADYATEHTAPEDTIMVYGSSMTIQKYLLDAAKRRRFTVIQVEAYPNETAAVQDTLQRGAPRSAEDASDAENRLKRLTASGVEVIYAPDSAVFALMPRVSKVVLSAQGIYSNGGCVTSAGSTLVTKAAQFYKIPTVVVGAIYRLSPEFPYDASTTLNGDTQPGGAVPYEDAELVQDIEVVNALREYIPPDQINLIITNIGGFSPAFMSRIATDHYRDNDVTV